MKKYLAQFTALILTMVILFTMGMTAYAADERKVGDVTGDGEITMLDVTLLQKAIVKLSTLDDTAKRAGDVTGDKTINMLDVVTLQKYIAKLITEFPVESMVSSDSEDDDPIIIIGGGNNTPNYPTDTDLLSTDSEGWTNWIFKP